MCLKLKKTTNNCFFHDICLIFVFGLHFNPTTFEASATAEKPGDTTIYSGSAGYDSFNTLKAGTYNLHPIALSGSAADVAKVTFVYKSGLATGGF